MRWVWDADWETELTSRTPAVRDVLDEAGDVVKAGAQRRCPVSKDGSHGHQPGHLRDSIEAERGQDTGGPYVDVEAIATTPDGYRYGLGVELGTKPHIIKSHGNYPLRNKHTGAVFGRIVDHPGNPPIPFLRPALDDIDGRTFT